MISEIWRYDYMGSAEFEFGDLPKSLEHIAKKHKNYTIGSVKVKVSGKLKYSDKTKITKEGDVFFVTEAKYFDDTKKWIETMAKGEGYEQNYRTKENVGLNSHLIGKEYSEDNTGWHDIHNHYLFFTDKSMCEKFCKLLGIE